MLIAGQWSVAQLFAFVLAANLLALRWWTQR